jgi:hypothetical protein
MEPCLVLLAVQYTSYLNFSCNMTLLPDVSKKLQYFETSGSACPVTQYRIAIKTVLSHTGINIVTTRKYH